MVTKRLVKVDQKRVETLMTPAKWRVFIEHIQNGDSVAKSLEAVDYPKKEYDTLLVVEPEKREQVELARAEHYRRLWPDDLVTEIATELIERQDVPLKMIILEYAPQHIRDPYSSFFQMLNADPVAKQRMDEARRIQMEAMADQMLAIARDKSEDVIVEERETRNGPVTTLKSHPTAVRRAEVEIKTMQWLMERIHHKRFGNRVQQDVNVTVKDHATELAEARQRRLEARERKDKFDKDLTVVDDQ